MWENVRKCTGKSPGGARGATVGISCEHGYHDAFSIVGENDSWLGRHAIVVGAPRLASRAGAGLLRRLELRDPRNAGADVRSRGGGGGLGAGAAGGVGGERWRTDRLPRADRMVAGGWPGTPRRRVVDPPSILADRLGARCRVPPVRSRLGRGALSGGRDRMVRENGMGGFLALRALRRLWAGTRTVAGPALR